MTRKIEVRDLSAIKCQLDFYCRSFRPDLDSSTILLLCLRFIWPPFSLWFFPKGSRDVTAPFDWSCCLLRLARLPLLSQLSCIGQGDDWKTSQSTRRLPSIYSVDLQYLKLYICNGGHQKLQQANPHRGLPHHQVEDNNQAGLKVHHS